MSNPNTDPTVLAMLEEETGYVNSQKRASYAQRVKIPKGHEWRVRFLPVEQGPRKTFWARYAFHWINSRPTLCVRHTARDFGGVGPDAACALCNMSEKLNADRDEFVSKIGYKASAVTQWLMYCLVYERDDGQTTVKVKEPDLWTPWEFWLTRPSFEDLSSSFKKGLEYSAHSFMDLFEGNDFWVSSKKNGLRFSANRPSELVGNDRYDEVTGKIWGNLKFQTFKIQSTRELELAARKLEEYAMTGTGSDRDDRERSDDRGRGGRGREDERSDSRSRHTDDYDERDDRRSRRNEEGTEDRSRRHQDDERHAGPPQHDDDNVPMGEAPRGERRESAPRPAPVASPAPPARPSAPAAARPQPQPAPAMPSRPAPPPARSLPPPPASRAAESSVEEDEHVPEERHDPAPPQALAEGEDTPPPVEEAGASSETAAPVSVAPTAPPRPPRLSDRLRNGISAADRRA